MEQSIINRLKNEYEYCFSRYLKEIADQYDEKLIPQKWVNTLELFTFGSYSHYLKYRDEYADLDNDLTLKLLELTILSITNDFENCNISIDDILNDHDYGLKEALKSYSSKASNNKMDGDELLFNKILIAMADKKILDVLVDDETRSLYTGKPLILRDVYDSRTMNLRVLKESDIPNRSLDTARIKLKSWLDNSISPLVPELNSNKEESSTKITRKRKQSENLI
ncbi:uncharacterized protein PRCAT00000652001 [Priceomyces carsonii]|uniref:uncharacterized protein n=1 Tax=Priceomyces carsonii TaxID=28549 RepID=UPI002ED855EB|nr:unnamed protein product [Priceomyces carsonii]